MSKENHSSKAAQCNDKENTAIAMVIDGSRADVRKAATIRGSVNGSNSKPTSNGSK